MAKTYVLKQPSATHFLNVAVGAVLSPDLSPGDLFYVDPAVVNELVDDGIIEETIDVPTQRVWSGTWRPT